MQSFYYIATSSNLLFVHNKKNSYEDTSRKT